MMDANDRAMHAHRMLYDPTAIEQQIENLLQQTKVHHYAILRNELPAWTPGADPDVVPR